MKQIIQISSIGILLFSCLNMSCNNNEPLKTENIETIKEANIDYKSKNVDNLQASYKGEVTAKYKAYSEKAELGKSVPEIIPDYTVNTTKENLSNDINGELYEFNTMYPDFLQVAEKAGSKSSVTSLSNAFKTEKKHMFFYEKALGDINSNTLMTRPSEYFICPSFGNTYENVPPGHCDFCNTLDKEFIKID